MINILRRAFARTTAEKHTTNRVAAAKIASMRGFLSRTQAPPWRGLQARHTAIRPVATQGAPAQGVTTKTAMELHDSGEQWQDRRRAYTDNHETRGRSSYDAEHTEFKHTVAFNINMASASKGCSTTTSAWETPPAMATLGPCRRSTSGSRSTTKQLGCYDQRLAEMRIRRPQCRRGEPHQPHEGAIAWKLRQELACDTYCWRAARGAFQDPWPNIGSSDDIERCWTVWPDQERGRDDCARIWR